MQRYLLATVVGLMTLGLATPAQAHGHRGGRVGGVVHHGRIGHRHGGVIHHGRIGHRHGGVIHHGRIGHRHGGVVGVRRPGLGVGGITAGKVVKIGGPGRPVRVGEVISIRGRGGRVIGGIGVGPRGPLPIVPPRLP